MAYDDRNERARWREQERGGRARPQRLGDRNWREGDDPDYGEARYGGAPPAGYGAGSVYGLSSDPDSIFGAPGYDASFAGPRFDRLDVGSTGTHGVHPVSSPYGGAYRGAIGITPGGGYGSSARRYAELGRHGDHPHYAEWRSRQIDQLDHDYDEYRREHQAKFDREFGAWRARRGEQRAALGRVTEHMVVGSDGGHVGKVDRVHGDRLILTKSDSAAGGHHLAIPCGSIDSVDDKVTLDLTADEATQRWREEAERVRIAPHFEAMSGGHGDPFSSRALFERDRGDVRGPHILNRSFAGTYRDDE